MKFWAIEKTHTSKDCILENNQEMICNSIRSYKDALEIVSLHNDKQYLLDFINDYLFARKEKDVNKFFKCLDDMDIKAKYLKLKLEAIK